MRSHALRASLRGGLTDADAIAYVEAVEAADGQSLETDVRRAYEDFIVGCKSDGIWSAIKASCILAGARTLAGALVPLVGTAPSNANFVSGDYNRETGLIGDASTKYLNSNYAFPTGLQNNCHIGAYYSSFGSGASVVGGYGDVSAWGSYLSKEQARLYQSGATAPTHSDSTTTGFRGASRSSSSSFVLRGAGSDETQSVSSTAVTHQALGIFARRRNTGSYDVYSDPRLAFYSLGESLTLSSLDSRVSTLMSDLAAAIP